MLAYEETGKYVSERHAEAKASGNLTAGEMAKLLNKPEVLHDEYTHNRILLNCANQGIPDGATAMATPSTDGASHEACIQVVALLRQTLLMSFKEIVRESR